MSDNRWETTMAALAEIQFNCGTYNEHDRAVHMTVGPMLDNVHVAVHARQERAEQVAKFIDAAPAMLKLLRTIDQHGLDRHGIRLLAIRELLKSLGEEWR